MDHLTDLKRKKTILKKETTNKRDENELTQLKNE